MKIEEKDAYYNERCFECRTLMYRKDGKTIIVTPTFRKPDKSWKLCSECAKKLKGEEKWTKKNEKNELTSTPIQKTYSR